MSTMSPSSRDLHKQQLQKENDPNQPQQPRQSFLSPSHPDAEPIPVHIPPRLQPQQQNSPTVNSSSPQQKPLSPFERSARANGATNPFGSPNPRGAQQHQQQSHQSPNSTLPTNPYDQTGPPGLATNFVDVDCDCVKNIRQSKCDLPFQSFASCHNAVLNATMRRNMPPMFFQCEGHYARMMMCIQSAGLSRKLIEDPKTDTVFVKP